MVSKTVMTKPRIGLRIISAGGAVALFAIGLIIVYLFVRQRMLFLALRESLPIYGREVMAFVVALILLLAGYQLGRRTGIASVFQLRTIKFLWVLASIWVLIRAYSSHESEPQIREFVSMATLSFPSSLALFGAFLYNIRWAPNGILRVWIEFFVVGIIQWFIIAPYCFRILRHLFPLTTQESAEVQH